MAYSYRIFCIGDTAKSCEAGHLTTLIPLEVGHVHKIKGKDWKCTVVSENMDGEPLADFRPYLTNNKD